MKCRPLWTLVMHLHWPRYVLVLGNVRENPASPCRKNLPPNIIWRYASPMTAWSLPPTQGGEQWALWNSREMERQYIKICPPPDSFNFTCSFSMGWLRSFSRRKARVKSAHPGSDHPGWEMPSRQIHVQCRASPAHPLAELYSDHAILYQPLLTPLTQWQQRRA